MDRIAAIQAFVRVVEAGSFARAAQRLRSSTSSISRQIAGLEQHLGARLLNRTTRKLSLTEGGQAFYERSVQLLAELEEAEQLAGATTATPRGTIRRVEVLYCNPEARSGREVFMDEVQPCLAGRLLQLR